MATYSGGKLNGAVVGTTNLVARAYNGVAASIPVTVYAAPTAISLDFKSVSIGVKDKLQLNPMTSTGYDANCTFTSSNSAVAKVSSAGLVTAKKAGTAKITAKSYNGKKATCTVKVYKRATSFTLSEENLYVMVGEKQTLSATFPKNTGAKVNYSSSNPNVATVTENGAVVGRALGSCTIIATIANGTTHTCAVSVLSASERYKVRRIVLSTSAASVVKGGKAVAVKAAVKPADASNQALTWQSSNTAIATVDASGNVTAKDGGTVTITATAKDGTGVKGSITLTCTNPVVNRALLVSESHFYWGYYSGWEKITRNKGDVTLMKKTLNKVKGIEGGKFKITTKDNTTNAELKSLIAKTFADADDNDVSLFFIATHGDSSSTGSYAGALSMASHTAVRPDTLTIGELRDCLLNVPGKVIVMLESCGSGAAIYDNSTPSLEAAERDAVRFDEMVVRAFQEADPGLYEPVPAGEGLAANTGELRRVNKFYVLSASAYMEDSWGYEVYSGTGNNYFTKWLAAGIGKSGSIPADKKYGGNKNGKADLYEIYRYISAVGDNYAFKVGGYKYYQHVQVYPSNTRYEMFK